MDKKMLELWYAYPDDLLKDGVAEGCAALLSDDERVRAGAFRFERDRREFLATRALVRTALSSHRATPPEGWRFSHSEFGKPSADPDCGLHFNLGNSHTLVVCLISDVSAVGVDVEPLGHMEQIAELAPSVFSSLELAQLDALQGGEKLSRGLSLWTLKESYIKARGMGLSMPLKRFSFLFGEDCGIRLELDPGMDDHAERWRFCLLDHAGHRIALMVDQVAGSDLQIWDLRHLAASPARLSSEEPEWFPRTAQCALEC
jgi:4'-phosphopantetheinyl transferase